MEVAILICILLIVYPYVIYPIILKLLLKFKADKGVVCQEDSGYKVSLVIAAYNEESVIRDKLDNSLALELGNNELEIIVGSDGSSDKTNEYVSEYEKRYSNIKLINYTDRAGKVNVINKTVPQCNGEIVVLSDANAMYNKQAIVNLVKHFVDARVGCVAGEKRVACGPDNISQNEGMYWKLESFLKTLEGKLKTVIGADGACYAIRKELFIPLHKDTVVDDFLLSMKIVEQGYSIAYEQGAFSSEEVGQSLQQELKRKIRIAAGNFYNLKFLGAFFRFNLESFMFISHKFLRWVSPIIFIVLTGLLALKADNLISAMMLLGLLLTYLLGYLGYVNFGDCLDKIKLVKIITYFYMTVFAQLLGFFKYLSGTQKAIWETIRE